MSLHIKKLRKEFNAKLAESGLTARDAKKLGFVVLTAQDLKRLHPELAISKNRGGFTIPYFTETRSKDGCMRFRYLEEPGGFEALTAKKPIRYAQAKNSGSHIYLPPYCDWELVMKDAKETVVITEKEPKAACASKSGILTIGLGGVWNFRGKKSTLLKTLDAFNLETLAGHLPRAPERCITSGGALS